jgi:hypothetical protein
VKAREIEIMSERALRDAMAEVACGGDPEEIIRRHDLTPSEVATLRSLRVGGDGGGPTRLRERLSRSAIAFGAGLDPVEHADPGAHLGQIGHPTPATPDAAGTAPVAPEANPAGAPHEAAAVPAGHRPAGSVLAGAGAATGLAAGFPVIAGAARARRRRREEVRKLILPDGTAQFGMLRPDGTWEVTSRALDGTPGAEFVGRYDYETRSFVPIDAPVDRG